MKLLIGNRAKFHDWLLYNGIGCSNSSHTSYSVSSRMPFFNISAKQGPSFIMTSIPGLKENVEVVFHFLRCCNVVYTKYLWKRFQKSPCKRVRNCQGESLFKGRFDKSWSGNAVRGANVRKWPGVKALMLFGSLLREQSGRKFGTASILFRTVLSLTSVHLLLVTSETSPI